MTSRTVNARRSPSRDGPAAARLSTYSRPSAPGSNEVGRVSATSCHPGRERRGSLMLLPVVMSQRHARFSADCRPRRLIQTHQRLRVAGQPPSRDSTNRGQVYIIHYRSSSPCPAALEPRPQALGLPGQRPFATRDDVAHPRGLGPESPPDLANPKGRREPQPSLRLPVSPVDLLQRRPPDAAVTACTREDWLCVRYSKGGGPLRCHSLGRNGRLSRRFSCAVSPRVLGLVSRDAAADMVKHYVCPP